MEYKQIIEFSSIEYLDNMASLYHQFLKDIQIPIPKAAFKEKLLKHPNFPTIVAFLDTCDALGINASVVTNPEACHDAANRLLCLKGSSINDLTPFMIISKQSNASSDSEREGNGYYIIVKNNQKTHNLILNEMQLDDNASKHKFAIKSILASISIAMLMYYGVDHPYSGYIFLNSILSALGLYVTVLIFYFYNGANASGAPKVCDIASESEGCHKAINFKPLNKLPIDIPSLTFSVFTTHFLIGLMSLVNYSMIHDLAFLSYISLLAVISSLLLQKFILKAWCNLCLLVSAIILLQSILFFTLNLSEPLNLAGSNLAWSSAILLLVILCSSILSSVFPSIAHFTHQEQELTRIKRNPYYIKDFKYLTNINFPENNLDLVLGETQAKIEIQLLLSLDCGGCALIFEQLNDILKQRILGLKVRIKLKPIDDIALNTEVWQLTYAQRYNEAFTLMQRLYRQPSQSAQSIKLFNNIDGSFQELLKWHKSENIQYTPLISINGHMFIHVSLDDLIIMIRREARIGNGNLSQLSII